MTRASLILLALLVTGCRDHSNDGNTMEGNARYALNSSVDVYIDPLTGCHYLTHAFRRGGALAPRMDASGKQICEPPEPRR